MGLEATVAADVMLDRVTFDLRVTNASDDAVDLTFGSGQTGEFVVSADDEVVWRWSDGRFFTQQVRHETLAPGEAITAEGQWDGPARGTYRIDATLTAIDTRPSASTTFQV